MQSLLDPESWTDNKPLTREFDNLFRTKNVSSSPFTLEFDRMYVRTNKTKCVQCDLLHKPVLFLKPFFDPTIIGMKRLKTGYLTIGIPSVRRPNTNHVYLYDTLDSLINTTNTTERQDVTVVIMSSDFNATYNTALAKSLWSKYGQHFLTGFFRLIRPPLEAYPYLGKVKKTFKDPPERLRWRAKQNIDFAYLQLYSMNISEYYVQLEDDVITATNYLTEMKRFIMSITKNWFMLEFSKLGFIGKLVRSKDLQKLASYLLYNYDEYPGDLMLGFLQSRHQQTSPIHCNASLFQHIGKFSSLKNKIMPSIDKTFKDLKPIMKSENIRGDNPPAKLITDIQPYENYLPINSYDGNSSSYFWGKNPKRNSYFGLIFPKPYNFSRIIVETGNQLTLDDSMGNLGHLYVATDGISAQRREQGGIIACGPFKEIAVSVGGQIDTRATGTVIPNNVVCLNIKLLKPLKTWLIIRNIELLL